ncbi:MAG: S1 RNA-binding domain-containing protein [Candidatus Eremiobacteraeota bacterium]|nr:S1 RNA-binding domain-containing protein [Candidatus Eremiobacteraeota bacterium]
MSLEIGAEVEGVVTGITNFGAFVKLPEGNTGLIHISEVADDYVRDVRHYINEKDKITVKVLGKNNKGKYDLSLKQATTKPAKESEEVPKKEPRPVFIREREPKRTFKALTFEDKLKKFIKESDERILDLKRNTESKRGKGRRK